MSTKTRVVKRWRKEESKEDCTKTITAKGYSIASSNHEGAPLGYRSSTSAVVIHVKLKLRYHNRQGH